MDLQYCSIGRSSKTIYLPRVRGEFRGHLFVVHLNEASFNGYMAYLAGWQTRCRFCVNRAQVVDAINGVFLVSHTGAASHSLIGVLRTKR
jgi:hypothetical protein